MALLRVPLKNCSVFIIQYYISVYLSLFIVFRVFIVFYVLLLFSHVRNGFWALLCKIITRLT